MNRPAARRSADFAPGWGTTAMSEQQPFQRGDVVHHPRRPEWGRGVVKEASRITYKGAAAQRVAVQFANKGRVVINTAVAPLTRGEQAAQTDDARQRPSDSINRPHRDSRQPPMQTRSAPQQRPESATDNADAGWLNELEQAQRTGPHGELAELPEAMTDPFSSPRRRLDATLESYRFTNAPRSLIDWAVAQTGLDDPLSRHTRHELEEAFERFQRLRDQHLKQLVQQLKQKGEQATLNDALQATRHRDARNALHKLMR